MSEIDHTHGMAAAGAAALPLITHWIRTQQTKKKITEFLNTLEDCLEDDIISKSEIRKLLRLGRRI